MTAKITFFLALVVFYTNAQQVKSIKSDYQTVTINNGLKYEYTKPTFLEMVKYVPKDLAYFGKYLIQKENLLPVGAALISTVAIIPFDQKLTDDMTKFGSNFGLDKDAKYDDIAGLSIVPNDLNAIIYYIGNGGTTLLLSGGFYLLGKINNNYRSLTTANELVEVLISIGVVTQTIKRITGRQSPNRAIESGNPGGHWTPFPSLNAYYKNTPNYDAMPSGHLATFMATITVISTNYPEIKWIKPVGYTLAGLLSFQMVSSHVHWTSDYPIAILAGYVIGKHVANRRIKKHQSIAIGSTEINYKTNFSMSNLDGDLVYGIKISF